MPTTDQKVRVRVPSGAPQIKAVTCGNIGHGLVRVLTSVFSARLGWITASAKFGASTLNNRLWIFKRQRYVRHAHGANRLQAVVAVSDAAP